MPMVHLFQLVLYKPKTSERLAKWLIELGKFDVQFVPRTAIIAQALVDFVANFMGHSQTIEMVGDALVGTCTRMGHPTRLNMGLG